MNNKSSTFAVIAAAVLWAAPPGYADGPATRPAGPPPVAPGDSILSEYTPQAPPNPDPPPYSLLRFNEDYSYLADPRNRTDPFDGLKYIPLNRSDPQSYLSFGGGVRERFEDFSAPGFGLPGAPVRNDYLLQRLTLDADLHLDRQFRFFAQTISGLQLGGSRPPSAVDNDPIDLQQAFADFRLDREGTTRPEYVILRGGRFELSLGSGRLVATRAAPNIPFKFDGGQVIAAAGDAHLYAFFTKPARENKYAFDDEFSDQQFWGVYATSPRLSERLGLRADLYYLGFRDDRASYATGHGTEERHTFGTRLFGKAAGFDYDVEPVLQTGRLGDRGILAWTVGSSEGYTFDRPWHPRLGTEIDVASGDTGHNGGGRLGTFNPLFFKAGFFNDASLIRPSNIVDVHPTLQFEPVPAVVATLGSDTLWRYTTNDGVYGPSGNLELPAGHGSHYLATTAEASVQVKLNRHLEWTASYVHFFTADYVAHARGHSVDFLGTWFEFTF